MSNVTLAINDNLLEKSKKVLTEKNTTLNKEIRRFLEGLVNRESYSKEQIIKKLKLHYTKTARKIGNISWKREDLYER
jgi:serine/threonine protein kinase HipA of HipAB toxin-antitoxin module